MLDRGIQDQELGGGIFGWRYIAIRFEIRRILLWFCWIKTYPGNMSFRQGTTEAEIDIARYLFNP